ncbi:MAG: D-tyrosyl-tRNA(Tyr) deacylase [Alphaproteobacteria bacterium]|nr:D-tyrosyl-tRNA(Tyr) deacylase [Alphaproteobacteria bacterium]
MKTIIQRVNHSSVVVSGDIVGKIGTGLCVLVGAEPDDTSKDVEWMANKLVNLRIFEDENGKMNKSLLDINGDALLVSQFTLLADCSTGRRPSFTGAGDPKKAEAIFDALVDKVSSLGVCVQTGVFGADMTVQIENNGPATFILESPKK